MRVESVTRRGNRYLVTAGAQCFEADVQLHDLGREGGPERGDLRLPVGAGAKDVTQPES
jgi:hypothetical protein